MTNYPDGPCSECGKMAVLHRPYDLCLTCMRAWNRAHPSPPLRPDLVDEHEWAEARDLIGRWATREGA